MNITSTEELRSCFLAWFSDKDIPLTTIAKQLGMQQPSLHNFLYNNCGLHSDNTFRLLNFLKYKRLGARNV